MNDETQTPEAVVKAAAAAYYSGDWFSVAALTDPASLIQFKRSVIEGHESRMQFLNHQTVEGWIYDHPGVSREDAAKHIAALRTQLSLSRELRKDGRGIETLEEVEASTPAEVYAAYLEAHAFSQLMSNLEDDGRISEEMATRFVKAASDGRDYVIIGAVYDGEKIAHVLHREHESVWEAQEGHWIRESPPDEVEFSRDLMGRMEPRIHTCRRQPDGSWRLLADNWLFEETGFATGE